MSVEVPFTETWKLLEFFQLAGNVSDDSEFLDLRSKIIDNYQAVEKMALDKLSKLEKFYSPLENSQEIYNFSRFEEVIVETNLCKKIVTMYSDYLSLPCRLEGDETKFGLSIFASEACNSLKKEPETLAKEKMITKKYQCLSNAFKHYEKQKNTLFKEQFSKSIHQLANFCILASGTTILLGKITQVSLYKFGLIALLFTCLARSLFAFFGSRNETKVLPLASIQAQLLDIDKPVESGS